MTYTCGEFAVPLISTEYSPTNMILLITFAFDQVRIQRDKCSKIVSIIVNKKLVVSKLFFENQYLR